METLEKQRPENVADSTTDRISPASKAERVSLQNGNSVYSDGHHHSHSGEHCHSDEHHHHSDEHHHEEHRHHSGHHHRRSRSGGYQPTKKLLSNKRFCILLGIFMTALLAFLFVLFLYIGNNTGV